MLFWLCDYNFSVLWAVVEFPELKGNWVRWVVHLKIQKTGIYQNSNTKTDIIATFSNNRKEKESYSLEWLLRKIQNLADPTCNSYNETKQQKSWNFSAEWSEGWQHTESLTHLLVSLIAIWALAVR